MERARYWHALEDGRFRCDLCPRACTLKPGQRAYCFVREAGADGIYLSTYGRSVGFAVDPIEKKPLHHFFPGTFALSFGTAGCNLGCVYCQNHELSRSRAVDRATAAASPEAIAQAALDRGCRSVAFTYNDPVVWAEYAIDVAKACHAVGVQTVAVTNGYINPAPRTEFFGVMDAANVDLKAVDEGFYTALCSGRLGPVLDTLRWVRAHTDVWLELTTLVIPGHNDTDEHLKRLTGWIAEHLGPDTPLHLTAFHPAHRLMNIPRTTLETLRHARALAGAEGLRFVYTGNVHDHVGDTTWCPDCGAKTIDRGRLALKEDEPASGRCKRCGFRVPGVFEAP